MLDGTNGEVGRIDRVLARAILVTIALLILSVLVLVVASYGQRYYHPTVSVVDRDIAAVEEQIHAQPQDLSLRLNAAYLYVDKGRYDDAIRQAEAVLRASPDNFMALQAMGMAYIGKKDRAQAINYLQHAVDLNKDNPMAKVSRQLTSIRTYLGQAYLEEGKVDEAISELRAAVASDASNADAFQELGAALSAKGDTAGALDAYRRAIRLVPDYREAYEGMARAYQIAGDAAGVAYANAMVALCNGATDKALETLRAIAVPWAEHPELHLGLAMAFERNGNREQALDEYRQALRLAPDSFAAQQGVAKMTAGGQAGQ